LGLSLKDDEIDHYNRLIETRRKELSNFENRLIQINTLNDIILTILIAAFLNKNVLLVEKILLSIYVGFISTQLFIYIYISFPRKIKPELESTNDLANLKDYYAKLKSATELKAKLVRASMVLFSVSILLILSVLMIVIFLSGEIQKYAKPMKGEDYLFRQRIIFSENPVFVMDEKRALKLW